MIEDDPIKNDARRAVRRRKLGEDAACAGCGRTTEDALIPLRRTLVEQHHAVGRAHDHDLTIPLCRNCHAEATERMRDTGTPTAEQRTVLERVIAVLKGLAAFFSVLAEKCAEWARILARFLGALDAHLPEWRELEDAR